MPTLDEQYRSRPTSRAVMADDDGALRKPDGSTVPVGGVNGKTGAVALAKADMGLGNVDNTADSAKPVSTAQAAAIAAKMDATMPALQAVFDSGTPAQKAAFQSSVSGAEGVITRQLARMGRVQQSLGALGNSISADPLRWWELAALKSRGQFVVSKNASVGGNTTAAIIARMAADWPAGTGDIAMHQECTNDYGSAATPGVSYAQHSANVRAIYSYMLSVGTLPIGVFPPTRDSAPAGIARMGLCDYAVAREFGVPFIFPWRQFVRPDTGAFTAAAGAADGVHPSRSAHALAATDAWAQIQAGGFTALLPLSNIDGAGQRVSNVLFLTDSNSDGRADGIVSYGDANAAESLVAGTGGVVGNWQVMQGNGTSLHVWEVPIPLTGIAAGDKLLLSLRLKVEILAVNAQCTVMLKQHVGGTGYPTNITPGSNTTAVEESTVCREITAIPGLTAINFVVTTNVASARCSIAQLQLYNLTGATR